MKKNTIYKSVGLYTNNEIESIKKEYECRAVFNGEYNDIDYEDLQMYNDDEWRYTFGDDAEWKDSWVNEIPVIVTGRLGLWNGPHNMIPKHLNSIIDAVYLCIKDMDEVEIYEDQYGNLKIDAYHHDGTNHFVVKRKTDKGNRCLHFTKLWNDYLEEENAKWKAKNNLI